jgi:predicted O-linked N-acetylglucosamine transferase (SPINDLY family)
VNSDPNAELDVDRSQAELCESDRLLETATAQHRRGDLGRARELYQRILADAPGNPLARFRLGLLELQAGAPDVALAHVDQALLALPGDPRVHSGRAQVLIALGRAADAAAAYRRVLALDANAAEAQFALGRVLESLGDRAGARAAYAAAVRIRPGFADAFLNLGNCARLTGDSTLAESSYRRVLELEPRNAGALSNLGTLLMERGAGTEAITLLRTALELEPLASRNAVNLGIALCGARRFTEAEALLRDAWEREPAEVEAGYNLGIALQGQGRAREAADQYRRVALQRPDHAAALNNLGNALKELGEFAQAATAYEAALAVAPDSIAALNNSGCLLRTLGRIDDAEQRLRRALELDPDHATLHNNLGNVLKDAGDIDRAIECFVRAVTLDPDDAVAHGNLAYARSFQSGDPRAILAECLRWNQRFAAPLAAERRPHLNERSPDRRLRIGYVSPDFRDHCQALFTVPLLSHHDHGAFEIFAYASVERPDAYTDRIAGLTDAWRDVRALDDASLSERIREDRIDILVDLTMHMANGRPLVFARKPAPIQVAWLAYPGTTGLDTIDYRLTDPRLDPVGFGGHYSEPSAWLPDAFWIYDPLGCEPPVNALPALSRGYVTFGCLNNPCKVTEETLALWGKVLRAVGDARIELLAPPGRAQRRVLERLAGHGVEAGRVAFVSYRPRPEYLCAYHDIDIGLDSLPYNGHTTSLDAFWMGVPVVSRVGTTCAGRAGLSQLFQLGLLELAAGTDSGFVDAAVLLARDLPRLAALRGNLRSRLKESPLMDAGRFARNLEAFYRRAWQDYCRAA